MRTVAETIRDITSDHLVNHRGLLFGQCLTAVGWVAGTVPEMQECREPGKDGGIVELPTCDVAGPGFVVGAALAGRRPIFLCRYQGFMTYNLATIVNYAAKSREMWGIPCPLFVRAIAMEGGIGPVATGSHHSMAMRYPGIEVHAPMTPVEYHDVWDTFISNDVPIYCSEHRLSYKNAEEMPDDLDFSGITSTGITSTGITSTGVVGGKRVTLIGISAGRLSCRDATIILRKMGHTVCNIGITQLKPFRPWIDIIEAVRTSDISVVVDSDFTVCGAAEHVAHELAVRSHKPVYAVGLCDRTAGFAPGLDNRTPTAEKIVDFVITHGGVARHE